MCEYDDNSAGGRRSSDGHAVRRAVGLVALLAVLLVGCKEERTTSYPIPKETYTPHAPSAPVLSWVLPEGWVETADLSRGSMRFATFLVEGLHGHDVDVSIVPIPDMRAGELDNVNRWRGQVGLGPVTEAELDQQAEEVAIGPFEGRLFDMTSETPVIHGSHHQRILAASLPKPQRVWYFKMSGVAETVAEQKPAFLAFLKSLTIEEPEPSAMQTAMAPSMGAPMGGMSPPPAQEKPDWKIPEGWEESAGSAMRIGTFQVKREGAGSGEVAVTKFPGDVGTLHGNVVRWRGQAGLGPIDPGDVGRYSRSLDWDGVEATLVDTSGVKDGERDAASQRISAVIVSKGGYKWFFKLTGDPDLVGQEEQNLIEFAKSAQ